MKNLITNTPILCSSVISYPVIIKNSDDTDRWHILITLQPNGRYRVEDDTKYSLFPSYVFDPTEQDTPGMALDQFLLIENEILANL